MAKTFSGGIKLRRQEPPALTLPSTRPDRLLLPLPDGESVVVREDDLVAAGALVAAGGLHAPAVFSPIAGTVTALIKNEDGTAQITLTAAEGSAPAEPLAPAKGSLAAMSSEELLLALHRAGVPMPSSTARTPQVMIVDGVGGPFNASRLSLIDAYPAKIAGGAKILMKYFGVRRCLFALPDSHRKTAERLERSLPRRSAMRKIVLVKDKYPQSKEHLLVSTLCNLEIHPTKSPSSLGYPVVSPLLCLAVYEALVEGKPFTAVPISFSAEGVTSVIFAPIGTPVSDLPTLAEIPLAAHEQIVTAEGLFGTPVSKESVVTVSSEAFRVLPQSGTDKTAITCIGCRRCAAVCPTHLMPMLLYRALGKKEESRYDLNACLLCGCCSAVCPSMIPLTQAFAARRSEMIPIGGAGNV